MAKKGRAEGVHDGGVCETGEGGKKNGREKKKKEQKKEERQARALRAHGQPGQRVVQRILHKLQVLQHTYRQDTSPVLRRRWLVEGKAPGGFFGGSRVGIA